jgi:UDP-galactopyranose mutase
MGNSTFNKKPEDISYDIICFSHLRWDFVYQRPQHLLSRFAGESRVFFIEEPIFGAAQARMDVSHRGDGLYIVVPHLQEGSENIENELRGLLDDLVAGQKIEDFVAWYYTPQMLPWSDHLEPSAVVYDCMDELSAFKFAPADLLENERRLLERADVVFTGGQSLYEAKRNRHRNVHAFPSSIDTAHFNQARSIMDDAPDQAAIPHPRLGFCGVIDERFDTELLDRMAEMRPDWHFVMIGPVVKISEEALPHRSNIHYLGGKKYEELPQYLAGWDVALMPFAINESTRFISPTKTPEYLAAGKPVVSTAIRDVVRPYGQEALVEIASTAEEFVAAAERQLQDTRSKDWIERVDAFLAERSWDSTWLEMKQLIHEARADDSAVSSQAA